jgi:Fe-S cluster biogenesis protein NfuA
MIVSPDNVSTILDPLRQGFQADGADLLVEEATDDVVAVRLIITDDTCLECISPRPVLTRIVETTLRSTFPDFGRFELVDPRD